MSRQTGELEDREADRSIKRIRNDAKTLHDARSFAEVLSGPVCGDSQIFRGLVIAQSTSQCALLSAQLTDLAIICHGPLRIPTTGLQRPKPAMHSKENCPLRAQHPQLSAENFASLPSAMSCLG